MDSTELERRIAKRTGLPHSHVRLVLDTTREIAKEQVAMLENVVLHGMLRIGVRQVKSPKTGKTRWALKLSGFRELSDAVGADLRDVSDW